MTETWHTRLQEYLKKNGLNPSKIEEMAGLSHGQLAKALKSKTSLRSDALEKIFSVIDISPTWLFKNIGEMDITYSDATRNLVAEEFVLYLRKSQDTAHVLTELKELSTSERQTALIETVEEGINKLSSENVELKNKLLKLYEQRDELIAKVERML
ncbi:MAG: helix-turn-helix domain-containing protein [Fulvivirga sp.]